MDNNQILRQIPSVDQVLQQDSMKEAAMQYGRPAVAEAVRKALEEMRSELLCRGDCEEERCQLLERVEGQVRDRLVQERRPSLRTVYNGTGVILHTGLGRAPLGETVAQSVTELAKGYCSLEYDPALGQRGDRNVHFEKLLCRLTGGEAAMAVNNNAAAVLLCLTVMGQGAEGIVSRGELVEIGGKFRIPDVMRLGNVTLKEVGTTNRTRISDYREAIGEQTRLLLKVHTSNYKIVGFTEETSIRELSRLKEEWGQVSILADLGSGVLCPEFLAGAKGEPSVSEALKDGADLVCFSADKLLGGPQAGLIVGKRDWIEKLKKHPLSRALRIGKFTAAALEQVLLSYEDGTAGENIPVLRMLRMTEQELKEASDQFACRLSEVTGEKASVWTVPVSSQAGGGALPGVTLPGWGVAICPTVLSAEELEARLRGLPCPVTSLLREGNVVLDLRTFSEEGREYMIQKILDGELL